MPILRAIPDAVEVYCPDAECLNLLLDHLAFAWEDGGVSCDVQTVVDNILADFELDEED